MIKLIGRTGDSEFHLKYEDYMKRSFLNFKRVDLVNLLERFKKVSDKRGVDIVMSLNDDVNAISVEEIVYPEDYSMQDKIVCTIECNAIQHDSTLVEKLDLPGLREELDSQGISVWGYASIVEEYGDWEAVYAIVAIKDDECLSALCDSEEGVVTWEPSVSILDDNIEAYSKFYRSMESTVLEKVKASVKEREEQKKGEIIV